MAEIPETPPESHIKDSNHQSDLSEGVISNEEPNEEPSKEPLKDLNKEPLNPTSQFDTPEVIPTSLVLPYLLQFRLINAFTNRTFFQPDEYWQALEPAHHLVFGTGYLTWEWREKLRSFLHPALFAAVYAVSEYLGLEQLGVVYGPLVLCGVLAAVSELSFYRFVFSITRSGDIAKWALLISVTSSFNWYCITRSFSNTLEMQLTCIALMLWPWGRQNQTFVDSGKLGRAFLVAAFGCMLRPTNAIIWLVLAVDLLRKTSEKTKVVFLAVMSGLQALGFTLLLDYSYYGELTFPAWNFFKFNVGESIASFYGISDWSFYIVQAIPILLTGYLPFFIYGFVVSRKSVISWVIIVVTAAFSFIPHKEFRFLYPILPFMHLLTANGIYEFSQGPYRRWTKSLVIAIIALNTAIAVFFSQFHERGVIDVVSYIRDDYNGGYADVKSVGFLMPCHSTPFMSHIHRSDLDEVWFLTCEPPLHIDPKDRVNYEDEADLFYKDPLDYLNNKLPPLESYMRDETKQYDHEWPTHLVFYEQLEPVMKEFLLGSKYTECARFFNSYFHYDSRRTGDVIVYCKWPWE